MRALISVAAAVLALGLAAGAAAAQSNRGLPDAERVAGLPTYEDVGLAWEQSPSVRDMARFYRTTSGRGRRGVVELSCTPDASGALDCAVLSEDPIDAHYGAAGRRVLERARVRSVDGGSPAGRTFGFRVRFGNWPASVLPDRFHPVDQNLLWVERPLLAPYWNMSGQGFRERLSADVDCRARSNGALDCQVVRADDPNFAEAALRSMSAARVERTDGEPLEGSRLAWTLQVERQSNCGGGGRRYPGNPTGTSQAVTDNANYAADSGFPESSVSSGASVSDTHGGAPGCWGAMVQVR